MFFAKLFKRCGNGQLQSAGFSQLPSVYHRVMGICFEKWRKNTKKNKPSARLRHSILGKMSPCEE